MYRGRLWTMRQYAGFGTCLLYTSKPGEITVNEEQAAEYIAKAAEAGAEVVTLPELWNCGYQLADLPTLAQNMRGSSIRLLQKYAKKYGIFIFGGSIAEIKEKHFYNTAVAINAQEMCIRDRSFY